MTMTTDMTTEIAFDPVVASGFDLRLVAYAPNGVRLGVLPHPLDLSVGLPFGDVPSLSLTYTALAAGASYLAGPCEVALEWTRGTDLSGWVEPADARYLRVTRGDDQTDPTGRRTYSCPGYEFTLRKARLYPSAFDNNEGKRAFLSATPGTILLTMIQEAQARGGLAGLTTDFTTTHDSAGRPWANILTIYYEPGVDLATVRQNLLEQGVIDSVFRARVLRCFNPDTELAVDRATGAQPVDLRVGRDITEAPDSGTLEDLVTDIYVQGEGAATVQLNNPSTVSPWGRWESYITHGGVSDEGTMRLLGASELERGGQERVQMTRGLSFAAARWLPLRHYSPGDYVLAAGDDGAMQSLRVRQVTLTRDQNGQVGGNVVLNDRFVEREIRRSRRLAGITGGSTAEGGSGARPAPEGPDRTPPAQVAGLLVATAAYIDAGGQPRGQVTVSWGTVTTNADGTAADDVAAYEVWRRPNVAGEVWRRRTSTDAPDVSVTDSPYDVGSGWAFKVRAVDRSRNLGAFSAVVAVTIADDTTPPPTPSAGTATTRLGVIRYTSDGLTADGTPMPEDWSHNEVHMSSVDNFTPSLASELDRLTGPGSVVVTGQPYGAARYFRLVAVDRSGNKSGPSAVTSASTVALVDTDVIGAVIDGANIVDGSISVTDKAIANSVTAREIAALAIQAGMIAANAVTADNIAAGAVNAQHIRVGEPLHTRVGAGINLIPDPGFDDPDWRAVRDGYKSDPARVIWVADGLGGNTTWCARFVHPSPGTGMVIQEHLYLVDPAKPGFPLTTGTKLYASMQVYRTSTVTQGNLRVEVRVLHQDGTSTFHTLADATTANTGGAVFRHVEGLTAMPVTGVECWPYLVTRQHEAGGWTVDDVQLQHALTGMGPSGQSTTTSPAGIDLANSEGVKVISISSTPPNYISISEDGLLGPVTLAALTNAGDLSVQAFSVSADPIIQGVPLVGTYGDHEQFYSQSNVDVGLLSSFPRGPVLLGRDIISIGTTSEVGMMEGSFRAVGGRSYDLRVDDFLVQKLSPYTGYSGLNVRATFDGTPPTLASPIIAHDRVSGSQFFRKLGIVAGMRCNPGGRAVGGELDPGDVRVLVCLYSTGEQTDTLGQSNNPLTLWAEDKGLDIPDTAFRNLGGTGGGGATKKSYVSTWQASWSGSYDGGGAFESFRGNDVNQGYYGSGSGNRRSLVGFATNAIKGETAKTITEALTGATVSRVRARLHYEHWYDGGGGTAIIGYHSFASRPSTFGGVQDALRVAKWPRGASKWFPIYNSQVPLTRWKDGTARGLTVGPGPTTSREYYGRARGAGSTIPPLLEVTYTR